MTKLEEIKLYIEAVERDINLGKDYNNHKGGQHTNGSLPIFHGLRPSIYRELQWYCTTIKSIINKEE